MMREQGQTSSMMRGHLWVGLAFVLCMMMPMPGVAQTLNLDGGMGGYFGERIEQTRQEMARLSHASNSLPSRVGARWRAMAIQMLEGGVRGRGSGAEGAIAIETGMRMLTVAPALDRWLGGLDVEGVSPLSIESQRALLLAQCVHRSAWSAGDVNMSRGRQIDRMMAMSLGPLVELLVMENVVEEKDGGVPQALRRVNVLRESVATVEGFDAVRTRMLAMLDEFEDAVESEQWRPQVMLACRDFESGLLLMRRSVANMQEPVLHTLMRTFEGYRDPGQRASAIERLALCERMSQLFERIELIRRVAVNPRTIENALETAIDWVASDDTLVHVEARIDFLERLTDAILLGHQDDRAESDHGFSRIRRRLRASYLEIEGQALYVASTLFDEIETVNQPAATTTIAALERAAATQHHLAIVHEALDAVRRETGERLQPTIAKIVDDLLIDDDEQVAASAKRLATFVDEAQILAWPDALPNQVSDDARALREQWANAWRRGEDTAMVMSQYRGLWRRTWIAHWAKQGVEREPVWVARDAVTRLQQIAIKSNQPDLLMMAAIAMWHGRDHQHNDGDKVAGGNGDVGQIVREAFDKLVYPQDANMRLDEAILGWKVLAFYGGDPEMVRTERLGAQARDALDRIVTRVIEGEGR